jgi:hypothetical protein
MPTGFIVRANSGAVSQAIETENGVSTRSGGRLRRLGRPRLARTGRRWTVLPVLAMAASLTGCSLSSLTPEGAFEKALTLSPEPLPPYRKLVAAALKSFKDQGDFINLEISEPRWAEHLGGPAWLVCVKFNPKTTSYHYAFYIRKETVIESRFAVGTDHCGQRIFEPFDLK